MTNFCLVAAVFVAHSYRHWCRHSLSFMHCPLANRWHFKLIFFVVFHSNDTSYIRSFRHTVAHRVTPLIRSFFLSFRTQFQFIAKCTTAQKSMGDNIEMEEKKTQNEWTISNCIKCNYMFLFSRKMKLCAIVHAIQLLRRLVQWFRTIWIATVYWMVCGVLSFAWE